MPLYSNENIYNKKYKIHQVVKYPINTGLFFYYATLVLDKAYKYELLSLLVLFLYLHLDSFYFKYYQLLKIYETFSVSLPLVDSSTSGSRKDNLTPSQGKFTVTTNNNRQSSLAEKISEQNSNLPESFKYYYQTTPNFLPFFTLDIKLANFFNNFNTENLLTEDGHSNLFSNLFKFVDKQLEHGWRDLDTFEKEYKDKDITQVNFGDMKNMHLNKLHNLREQIMNYGKI